MVRNQEHIEGNYPSWLLWVWTKLAKPLTWLLKVRFNMKHIIFMGSILTLTACGQSIGFTGNHAPTQWHGLDANETAQAQAVYDYVDAQGAVALGVKDGQPHLGNVTDVTFVAQVFLCDENAYGPNVYCYGITYDNACTGDAVSQVALITTAGDGASPTQNVGCTALAHELMHTMSWNLTGDADDHHTNAAIWGSDGFVVQALKEFCPSDYYEPNNNNPPSR